jgi:hypothetical protein
MGVSKQALEQAFVDHKPKYGGLKEDYFALLYLAEEFGKPVGDIAHQIAFGNNDFGIDAFHFDPPRRNLYLFQFKWSENYTLFKESLNRLISAGMERVFGNPHQAEQNDVLLQLKACLHENQAIIDRVFIHFVYNGDPEHAENSSVLTALREDLEKKKYLIDNCFGRADVTLSFQFLSNETKKRRHVINKKTHRYSIAFPAAIETRGAGGQLLHIGLVSLVELHDKMYVEMRQRLFEKNIRAGLADEKPVNRAIRAALGRVLQGQADANEFVFNHNGITMFAERVEMNGDLATVTEPRILNGAQTVTSVAKFFEENEGNRALAENRQRLGAIRVLVKLVSQCDENFVTAVTINTNRQNPVDPANLRASDRMQLELQDKFRDELQIFYERQENSFEALLDSDLEDLGIEHNRAIKIKPLAQTFLAAQGEIDRMSRLPDVFEQEQTYRTTFKDSYLATDARRILVAYKIHFRLNRIIREIVEKGAAKYAYLNRARNLVWGLLIQGILNDPRLNNVLESYGTTLVAEADFSEVLMTIASTKVRFIIKDAFHEERYQTMLADEKYSFLRTKAAYTKCMQTAYEKYEWKKQSL